jgi:nucleoside-diphosphate-sugar epimerase
VVVYQMTSLAAINSVRRRDHEFAQTDRLRTEGLDRLLEAARIAGARRFVAQSFGNWNSERRGGPVKSEDDPLDRRPRWHPRLAAMRQLEVAVLAPHGIEGVVLCYANFYGPAKEMASFVVLSCQVQVMFDQGVGDESVCGRSDGSDWKAAGAASGCRWS